MTMTRNAKLKAEFRLKGVKPMVSGHTGQAISRTDWIKGFLGRGKTDAVTATAKKMDRMGYRPTERGGFKKTARKVF